MLAWAILHLVSLLFASTVDSRGTSIEKYPSGDNDDYDSALQFLEENDKLTRIIENKRAIADWNSESNLTEENGLELLEYEAEEAKFDKDTWKNATSFNWKDFKDKNATIYRWFKKLSVLGTAALPEEDSEKLYSLIGDMRYVYSNAKVCAEDSPADKPCELSSQSELQYDELKHIWADWRKVTGRKIKSQFLEYVKLSNEAAKLNGFKDAGDMWRESYETETFETDIEELWKTIEPFYKQLHAFVRRRLIEQYPGKGIRPDGPIPAHLLGYMGRITWGNSFEIVKPFRQKEFLDVTKIMTDKKMTALDMFKLAEEFFISLGLKAMTPEFWIRSIIEKPKDREIDCHPVAWDFSDGKDFRIKMCTRIDMEDLMMVHHEMGHIEYYQEYAHQPMVFRRGANPGFDEAVGDAVALSVISFNHWKKIGFMNETDEDEGMEINGLMKIALEKIAFLPFSYSIDSWRWKVFSGEISEDELNSKWWEEKLKYQGLCPPVRRTNDDLDAATFHHVVADVPYIRYFVSHVLQFQFYKALCEEAGYTGPLHQCDIYNSKEAGKLLSDTLSLGSSVHWTEAMKVITRGKSNKMDAQPMIEYFEPLMKWLKNQNEGETLGWKSTDPMMCPENLNIEHY